MSNTNTRQRIPEHHAAGEFARRTFDILVALLAIAVLLPFFALLALLILLEDGRPVLFSQERVGRGGKVFRIYKFRSMTAKSSGRSITAADDPRITRTGAVLRKFKFDELLQFVNVLKGDMSLCGPRPEVPGYVDMADPTWRAILQDRPGITDPASLFYRNEEDLLAASQDPERLYRESILPEKLRFSLRYQQNRSLLSDLKVIFLTLRWSLLPGSHQRFVGQTFF